MNERPTDRQTARLNDRPNERRQTNRHLKSNTAEEAVLVLSIAGQHVIEIRTKHKHEINSCLLKYIYVHKYILWHMLML